MNSKISGIDDVSPLLTQFLNCARRVVFTVEEARKPLWQSLLIAVGLVAVAMLGRMGLLPELGTRNSFLTFYPAVAVAAMMGGLWSGLLAMVLSAVAADYFWIEPVGRLRMSHSGDQLSMMVFVTNCVLIALVTESMHRAQAVARTAEKEKARAETQQQVTETHLVSLIELSDDAIFSHDLSGAVQSWNPGAARIFGYEADEIIGQPMRRLMLAEAADEDGQLMRRIERGERIKRYQSVRIAKDGRRVDVSVTVYPLLDSHGKVCGASEIVQDITEQKQADEALRHSAHSLREAQRLAGVGSWEWNPIADRAEWSEEMYRIFNRDVKLGPATYLEAERLYPAECWEKVDAAVKRTVATQQPYAVEVWVERADGERVWLVSRGEAVCDEAGTLIRLHGTVQDITDRKRAEALQFAVAGADIGTWHWNVATGEIEWSERCRAIVGDDAGHKAGLERFLNYVHADDRGRVKESVQTAMASQQVFESEFRVIHADGSARWAMTMGRGHYGADGKVQRVEGAIIDVTKRKQAEQQIVDLNSGLWKQAALLEAANKELESFSYSVSHDLRAPLRAVDGFSKAVLEDYGADLPAEGQRYLHLVRQGAQKMGALIDDLLTFSRLSRTPLEMRTVDMQRLVQESLQDLGSENESRQIQWTIDELPSCHGDSALLKQVWMNLLSNAIKYTRRCEKTAIEVSARSEGGRQVYSVRDNGAGFDMRYVHKLFGVFQRLHRAEDYEGTGVGLAIVQRIVHRHGGEVRADAAVNHGATFSFVL